MIHQFQNQCFCLAGPHVGKGRICFPAKRVGFIPDQGHIRITVRAGILVKQFKRPDNMSFLVLYRGNKNTFSFIVQDLVDIRIEIGVLMGIGNVDNLF